jgi:pyruvate dehydrogenase (quinone)
MGSGVPYAIAAKLAYPDRPVIACVGDGAFQMNGMNELITARKYAHRFKDPRFIVLVLHNNDLNMVTWEMRAMAGEPKLPMSQDLPELDYAAYAELIGFEGFHMDSADEVGAVWDRALAAKGPVLVDARTDPSVPPLPPHIELAQAQAIMRALIKGDPNAGAIIANAFKQGIH